MTAGTHRTDEPERLRQFKAEFFKALAHPLRIRVLELLRSGPMSVTQIQAAMPMLSMPIEVSASPTAECMTSGAIRPATRPLAMLPMKACTTPCRGYLWG